ncbi:primosomal replication protein [Vibrio ostreicida]|uniref:Primosomal replication protein n=1 Tax=Vibrio ostreicida TaxID=526588 RepID=A0ABT8BRT7_9VIBR|nr:primosomal replication protein [Vibrio ostreicida]MDN3609661.1 primosomal replication protein [Vibrio ostreicida]NPD09507.1 primosomal replication protein [Vibrio ostreicida]
MTPLNQLSSMWEQLQQQATELDNTRGEYSQPLFDRNLFHCGASNLVPCVEEAMDTFMQLSHAQEVKTLTCEQVDFLSERLICQLGAIKRELATQTLRRFEPGMKNTPRKRLNDLYQNLAQHQQWENRLLALVNNTEYTYQQASSNDKALALQTHQSAKRRLQRCQQAKIKIEKHITYKERNQ